MSLLPFNFPPSRKPPGKPTKLSSTLRIEVPEAYPTVAILPQHNDIQDHYLSASQGHMNVPGVVRSTGCHPPTPPASTHTNPSAPTSPNVPNVSSGSMADSRSGESEVAPDAGGEDAMMTTRRSERVAFMAGRDDFRSARMRSAVACREYNHMAEDAPAEERVARWLK